MNIYVGNLSYDVSEENLRQAFEAFGQVSSATIVKDKYGGQPRGFGFVEMPDRAEAKAAIENLNGKGLLGRQMNVNEAPPSTDRGKPGGQGGHNRRPGYGGRRHGRTHGPKPTRSSRPKSYRIVCAGCGKEVVVQVLPPDDKKLLCMECFKK